MFILIILITVLTLVCVYLISQKYNYWQKRGFPVDKNSKIPYGCLESTTKREKSMGMAIYDVYKQHKERFLGIYLLFRPAVLVRDAELARRILAQDFSSFHDRGVYEDEENDPLSANLFSMRGQSWRNMRLKLGPTFTSGKLKAMFTTSDEVGNKMVEYLKTEVPASGTAEVDLKEICTTYALDIIASTIFGLEINSFEDPNNKFRTLVGEARKNDFFNAILRMLFFLVPSFAAVFIKTLRLKNKVALGLLEILKETIAYREKHNIVRKDMLQLLMQLRNTGKVNEDDNNWTTQSTEAEVKGISMEGIAAQAFIFYIAGQETTASTAAFTIFELAQYPDLLKRAQDEVNTTLENCGGQITYDALQKMEFLELCIHETIRKYPGLPILNRECSKDYRIPDTDLVIEKGTSIVISLFGIHRDPEYFPEPEKYDPDRFVESNQNYNPQAYMPFGEGPRICIAQRMGRVNSKLAVVKILQNFNIEIMEKREIEIDNHSIAILPKGGVKVRLSRKTLNNK